MALWGGRFESGASSMFKQVNDSLPFDQVMASQDIQGSISWSRALQKAGVLTVDEQAQLESALSELKAKADAGELDFNASSEEDIHSFVEAALIEKLGDIGRKLHTGRSRNDQVATDFRLWVREHIASLRADVLGVIKSLLNAASRHQEAIIPGYTHLQRAQPIHFAHWCLAYVEMLKRDLSRLDDLKVRMNQCPLGSGALAGTTFPVDRHAIAEELGFDSPCLNSLDAVSDRDFVLELLFVASTSMMHLSRLAEDMIFYNSGEAGFLQLGDSVTSGSSLMPQKKNPDVPELIRGKIGRVNGHLISLLTLMKSQPLAYNKDNQEDKEPLFDVIDTLKDSLKAYADMVPAITVNADVTREAAMRGFSTATDLADYLVRKGLPFRDAHEVVGKSVAYGIAQSKDLSEMSLEELQQFSADIADDVFDVLTLEGSINARNHIGGTAPAQVRAAADRAETRLQQR